MVCSIHYTCEFCTLETVETLLIRVHASKVFKVAFKDYIISAFINNLCTLSVSIRLSQLEAVKTNCVFYRGDLTHLFPLVELPNHICLFIICVWYAFKTVVSAYKMYQWYAHGKLVSNTCQIPLERRRKHQYIIRVKKLLMRSPQRDDSEQDKIWNKIVCFIQKYTCDASFHYPLCFSSAVLIVIICIYQVSTSISVFTCDGSTLVHCFEQFTTEQFTLLPF